MKKYCIVSASLVFLLFCLSVYATPTDVKERPVGSPLARSDVKSERTSTAEIVLNKVEDCKKPEAQHKCDIVSAVEKLSGIDYFPAVNKALTEANKRRFIASYSM